MSAKRQVLTAALAAALCFITPTGWRVLASQQQAQRAPAGEYVPPEPAAAAGGAAPPPPAPPAPAQPHYSAPPVPPHQQPAYQQQQPPQGGYAAPPPAGHHTYGQDPQQQRQQQQRQPYYGGDQGYAQQQQPPSYQQPPPVYQQAYQAPPAYQQQQQPPSYQPPPTQSYGQPPPPPPQQQQQQPPPPPQQQQQYYQPPPPQPPQQARQQQQQQKPATYQAVPAQAQTQAGKAQQATPQQQQASRGNDQQGKRQAQQQPSQQRQQPARPEQQDASKKKKEKQKDKKQSKQRQPEEPLPYDLEPTAADTMTPEYQPRRTEEGGIVDVDQQTATLMEEWEKHMQNFIPEMLVTFSLGARSDEYFYEAIESDNVFLRGGFFVGGEEGDGAVDFSITDPDGDVIYKKSRSEGLFYFTAKKRGTYSFILSNHRWMESKTVTFAIGRGVETALLPKHLNNAEAMVEQLERQLKDIQAESSYLWIRQRSLNDAAQGFLQRLSWLSGIEFLMLIGTAAFHARYIVGLVSDKRIL